MANQPPLQFNRKTLVTSILTLFSGSAISQGLTALVLLLTARQIGPEGYGQYTSAIVFATFASILFGLGLDIWLLREGGSKHDQIGAIAGSVLGIKIGLGGIWFIGMIVLASLINSQTFIPQIVRLAALIVWFDSIFNTFQAIFKSVLRNQFTSSLIVGSDLAWFLGTLILAMQGKNFVVIYMRLRVGVLFVSLIIAGFLSWKNFHPHFHLPTVQKISRIFLPFAVSELLVLALLRADVMIISFTIGTEAVGLYAPAVSLINAIYLIPNSIHGVMLPVLSNVFRVNSNRAWRMARQLVFVQSSIGLGLCIGVLVISPLLISLLGPKFSGSLLILQILSFNLFFRGISFAMVAILIALNQQHIRTYVQIVCVILNVGLNLAVVYWAGIRGVAIIYVITEISLAAGYTLMVYLLRKKDRLDLV